MRTVRSSSSGRIALRFEKLSCLGGDLDLHGDRFFGDGDRLRSKWYADSSRVRVRPGASWDSGIDAIKGVNTVDSLSRSRQFQECTFDSVCCGVADWKRCARVSILDMGQCEHGSREARAHGASDNACVSCGTTVSIESPFDRRIGHDHSLVTDITYSIGYGPSAPIL